MSLLCRLWLLMLVVGVAGTIFFGWLAMAYGQDGGWDRSPSAQSDGLPPAGPETGALARKAILAQASPDSEWVKQVLRLEYTTFCQTVKKPPQQLVDAINEALKQDPKTWMPVVIWFNAIAEKYQKAGCGDA